MPSEFIYDPSEDYSPQKDNFLTPVYFEKEVLLPFIYNPDYNCTFVSETYGALVFEDNSIPFGINPQGHLIFWLGDINRLTPKIKGILKPYNISSDNNIESEFKQGQLDAEFTDNILEVELFLLLNKINEESQKRFNFKIFNSDIIPLDRLLEICSAYKRITFNNEDDFKRIISDLNEKLIETINRDELTKRMSVGGVLYTKKDFERVYMDSDAEILKSGIKSNIDHTQTEFRGQVAQPGFATGTVKIIIRAKDMGKMNQGDILVSIATDPDIVPAMKKAAAIVTDFGGLTSHAAIISREFNIPCIVGTQNATQLLKDGDLVEVDADKGVVRKI